MNTCSAALDAFERIARPDDDVGAAAWRKAADLPAHADRLRRAGRDHRQRLAPAQPGVAGKARQADEIAGILALEELVARVVVVDHADRDADPRARHAADIGLGRGQPLERGGQIIDRRGDDRNAGAGDVVGDGPAFGHSHQHQLERREFALEVEDGEDVAGALDVDEQILPPLEHRDQGRGIEAGQQHIVAALHVGAVKPRFVGVADDRARRARRSRREPLRSDGE